MSSGYLTGALTLQLDSAGDFDKVISALEAGQVSGVTSHTSDLANLRIELTIAASAPIPSSN